MAVVTSELNDVTPSALKGSVGRQPPTVLIATTSRWYPTARLAMALAHAGCEVVAVCPANHPLTKTKAGGKTYSYSGLTPLSSFAAAISDSKPDLVIPGDDLATRHLHRIYDMERKKGKADSPICALIERSLGAAEGFTVSYTRARFMEVAQEEGIRVPTTDVVANLKDLKDWVARNGLPFVLKANGTSGGDGVRIIRTMEEAEPAFRSLQAPPRILRAAKRALVNHDMTLIDPALRRRRFEVNAQTFVPGREATSALACWRGKVLAALHFEVINKRSAFGPATVVRLIEHAEMSSATEKMVRRLELSGLHGFDFMLQEQTGHAYLIETNPRATQVGHLALGSGRDIPAALFAVLSSRAVRPAPKLTENDTIALFPQEWVRDPESVFLRSAYHDIPWQEPELVHDCVSSHRRQTSWNARASRRTPAPVRTPKPKEAEANSYGVGLDWEASKSRHE